MTSDKHEEVLAIYNDHEQQKNLQSSHPSAISDLMTSVPILGPTEQTIRERVDVTSQPVERSEDIHTIPPTVRPLQRKTSPPTALRTREKQYESSESDAVSPGSDRSSDDEDESKLSPPNNPLSAVPMIRSTIERIPQTTPVEIVANKQSTVARTRNPSSTSRSTTENSPRQASEAVTTSASKFL